jgi:hypothetical protein
MNQEAGEEANQKKSAQRQESLTAAVLTTVD